MRSKYIFILFILIFISFLLLDIYMFKNKNLDLLKRERRNNLINLPKDEPIKIGVVWPFPPTTIDDDFKEGIEFALSRLNKQKILGREIEIIFGNDEWDIKVAKNIADKFANDEDIVAVIAHDDVDIAISASITYEYSGVIMISPAVSSPDFTRSDFNYIFRNTPNDNIIGKKLANFAKVMNFKKIIILNSRDTYSEYLSKAFTEQAIVNGLEIVYSKKFNKDDIDFSNILTDISPQINHYIDYDAIFIAGVNDSVITFIKQARQYGIFAPFLTGDMLDSRTILEAGEEMDTTIVATIYNQNLIYEKTQNFIDDFKKLYGHRPDTWGVQGYDAMMLLAEAIKRADSLDTEKISKQLKYMTNFDSIFGRYSLNTKGDTVDRDIYFKVVKDGKFHYLKKIK